MNNNYIDQELYNQFLDKMPIVCVDLLLYSPKRNQFLLIRRNQEPLKGNLYFPGGRLFKNETLENGCKRIAKTETGLDCEVRRFLGVYETDFANSSVEGIGTHTINLTYFLIAKNDEVKIDETSSSFTWTSVRNCPSDLDENLKRFVEQVFLDY